MHDTHETEEIARRLADVRASIAAAGGDVESVRVVAVTKKFGIETIRAAVAAGLNDIAENYAQEARIKYDALNAMPDAEPAYVTRPRQPRWHFIGQIQRNKVKVLAPFVDLWQSVDSAWLIDEIAKRAPGASILLQVNLSEQEGRGGCAWVDVPELLQRARDQGLDAQGLMGVAPLDGAEVARRHFRRLAMTVRDFGLHEVSMGMSSDLAVAVEEGATMVRIGSALFGPRRS